MTKYFKSGLYHDYLFSVGKINWKSSLCVGFGECLVNYTNYDGISTGQSHPHSLDERRASANLVGSVVVKTCEWVIVKSWLQQKKKKHSLPPSRALVGWSPTEIQLNPKYVLEPLSCKLGHYVRAPYRTPDLTWIIDNLTQAEAREKGRNLFRWLKFQLGGAVNLNRGGIQRTATDLASF